MTATLDTDEDDEMTEIVDAKFARVDLVGKAANGTAFLIAKGRAGQGLLPGSVVKALIAKAKTGGDDLSGVSTADLARTAVGGAGSDRDAALRELGLRSLAGEPAAPPAPAAEPTDLTPAPPDSVGTPADGAPSAVAKARRPRPDVQRAISALLQGEQRRVDQARRTAGRY